MDMVLMICNGNPYSVRGQAISALYERHLNIQNFTRFDAIPLSAIRLTTKSGKARWDVYHFMRSGHAALFRHHNAG